MGRPFEQGDLLFVPVAPGAVDLGPQKAQTPAAGNAALQHRPVLEAVLDSGSMKKVHLLGGGVSDPYGQGIEAYRALTVLMEDSW